MGLVAIFCRNAVETLEYFSRQLAVSFQEWGYETVWMDFEMLGLSAWKMRQAVEGKKAVLVTFNFIGLSGEEGLWELDEEGTPVISIWEKLGILCLNIMVDHPIYYYKQLAFAPPAMKAFCVDREHVAYMNRFYPGISCGFLPLAGNCTTQDIGPQEPFWEWQKRPYTLVFTANYVPIANIGYQLGRLDAEYRDFYYEIIEDFIQNPGQGLLPCMEAYLRREMPDIREQQLCEAMSNMPAVDLWIRTYFREKTVRALAEGGIKVHLFGKDWEQMECSRPENLACTRQMVGSAECVQAMASAKIALNTMPWFKDGAHDRVFTAMLQGAAALTDGSIYLEEQLTHMDTAAFYRLDNLEGLPGQVCGLLEEPERLYRMACRGKELAAAKHQWGHRAKVLKECCDLFF